MALDCSRQSEVMHLHFLEFFEFFLRTFSLGDDRVSDLPMIFLSAQAGEEARSEGEHSKKGKIYVLITINGNRI